MRRRSILAHLATALLIAGGTSAARGQSDSFFSDLDKPVPASEAGSAAASDSQTGTIAPRAVPKSAGVEGVPRPAKPAVGWANDAPREPDPALTSAGLAGWAPDRGSAVPSASKAVARKGDDKSSDPEPDEAVKPPPPSSSDPLDAKPAGAAPSAPTQALEPLPPLNAALKAALDKRDLAPLRGPGASERRKERDAVDFLYAAHGFAPVWSDNGKPVDAVDSVLARLARAGDDALALADRPTVLKTDGSPEEIAESDIALTDAVVSYARQATGARVDPRAISPLIGAKPALADPAEIVDMMAAAGAEAGDKLQDLNPVEPRYIALREKLAQMHAARPVAAKTSLDGPTLRVGMRDPRVPLIRSRFDLDAILDADADGLEYDTEVAAAVAGFQRANGLPASGVLTKRTIAALSGGVPSRLEGAIVANMEMWRWMPRDLGQDRIEVNVPDFLVTVFRAGEPVAENRVVVGKTETPTPLFSNAMKYLIINPVWNVPDSIIEKEFLPKGLGRLGHSFDVHYKGDKLVVRQLSGDKNALGRIKFMFPNDYSVYLHDTPSKALFAASRRAFSHGCVRVDQPFDFAQAVLNPEVPEDGKMRWSEARLRSMLGDHERYIYLPHPLPIHIMYFTATVDPETSRLKLRDDIYDYARKVAVALGQNG